MTIVQPKVHLLARQQVDEAGLDRFLAEQGVTWETDTDVAAEVLSEVAGRVCYLSFAKPRPGGNAAYLGHIKEVGHGSVLEHAVWSFLVTGVSRSFSHELVRHRAGFAYSQLSQRYVDESVCEVVMPADPDLREAVCQAIGYASQGGHPLDDLEKISLDILNKRIASCLDETIMAGLQWLVTMKQTSETYKYVSDYLTKVKQARVELAANAGFGLPFVGLTQEEKTNIRKEARGAARSVLPNATETKVTITANARALRHFLEMRCSRFAEAEIRGVAGLVYEVLVKESPNLFGDYQKVSLPDGSYELTTSTRKV